MLFDLGNLHITIDIFKVRLSLIILYARIWLKLLLHFKEAQRKISELIDL